MLRRAFQFGCFFLFVALSGCKSESLPDDPLFATRKPMQSKVQAGPPRDTPDREPTPPVQTFFVNR